MIQLSHAARRDLRAILDYLEQESQSLSIRRRFLVALRESCQMHESWPDLGKRVDINVSRHRNTRQFPIRRFVKYLVFYRNIEGGIAIERVVHGMRDLPLIIGDRGKS